VSLAAGITLAIAADAAWAAEPEQGAALVFAAGPARGNYNALAAAMAAAVPESGCELRIRETEGSYENASLLRDGEADIALLQSDVAYLEHYNRRPFLALASVYTEPIHVIAYRGLDLRRISDLLPEKGPLVVAVGAPGSGSSAHALAILDEMDLRPGQVEFVQQSIDAAAGGLRDREVDLAFVTTAVPSQAVQGLADERIISLLDIDRDIAHRLRRRNPFFVAAEIPYRAYGTSARNVQTLGTRTLLVSRPDLPGRDVESVLDALYAAAGRADARTLPFLRGLSPADALDGLAIPAHSAARRYHAERTHRYQHWFDFLRRNAVLLILAGAVFLTLFRLSRLAYFIHQFVLGRVLLSLAAVWLAGSVAMHLFERTKNSAFRSFGSSAIAILHYLFSGLESKYPVTTAGNVVAVLVLSLGVGVVTLFTATLVTLLVEHALNIRTLRRKPVPFLKLTGHTVIAGWSERTKRIIRQLRSPDLRTRPTVVVIAPQASATKVEDRRSFRGVWVVEGDRTQTGTLEKADISTAGRVVVLALESASGKEELSSICCALAVEQLAPAVHTIVETRSLSGFEHLTTIRADEIVATETLAERLMSQCVITPGIAQVYDELLSFGRESQEIYIVPLDRRFEGSCFREIRDRLGSCDAVLLGFWRRGEPRPRLNPPPTDSGMPLTAGGRHGDRLIVLADTPGALGSLRGRFKQWRSTMERIKNPPETEPAAPAEERNDGAETRSAPRRRVSRIGVCGWNEEARAVIRQLQESVIATHQDFEITVIDGPTTEDVRSECTRNVRFVFGDPTRSQVLENAGVKAMETLVVLADYAGAERESSSDHRALVICLAAIKVNPSLHLIVQVLHSENQEHFERLEGVEIVSVEDLAEKLLAQAVISPGITSVFLELLTATEDSNEIYVVPVPARWQGMTFSEIAACIPNEASAAVALGYRTTPPEGRQVIVLNPRQRKSERRGAVDWRRQRLGSEDALVVMAYEEPSW
jgi:hypothetical protein